MPSDFHWDFTSVLLLATVVAGLVSLLWRIKVGKKVAKQGSGGFFIETCRGFFPVMLAVLILRSFIFEPFRIPSGSMLPTLHIGDFIAVNKFSYGLRMPAFHNKLLAMGQPERGDVVVFRYPPDPSKDYIKRVIGLPGDTIAYKNKKLTINGQPLEYEYQGLYSEARQPFMRQAEKHTELLGDVEHDILVFLQARDMGGEVLVPAGHYFVMGDNRDNSEDSRRWGFVPDRNLVGKAVMIWMNWDGTLGHPDWHRIGDRIH